MHPNVHNQRFIGIDLGTTNSSTCFTSFNPGRKQFDDPQPVRFGNHKIIRSILLLDPSGQKAQKSGEAVYNHPEFLAHPERVHEQFKLNLGKQDSAAWYTQLLAGELLEGLKRTMNLQTLSSNDHVTTFGVPAEWNRNFQSKVKIVEQAIIDAGFPNVQAIAEPIAAIHYHAFLGDIYYEDRPQHWMVIDIGGGTTDLAVIRTVKGGQQPEVLFTFGEDFGGKDFDELFLNKLLLGRHWDGEQPNIRERLILLMEIRNYKEVFSNNINRGRDNFKRNIRVENVKNPVPLTKVEFASPEFGERLIDRFSGIITRSFLNSKLSLRDIDKVILTGGSARWYFVKDAINSFFGREATVLSENPELTIAKGLTLARTGFKQPGKRAKEKSAPDVLGAQETELDDILKEADQGVNNLDRETCRRNAKSVFTKYAAMSGSIALLLSPIPGASQPVLTGIETKLVMEISQIYGYRLNEKEILSIIGSILAGGTLLKIGVMEAMTFVPGAGWVLKGGVAASAIPAVGELAIKYFETKRFPDDLDNKQLMMKAPDGE